MDWGSTWDFLWHFLIIFAWIAYLLVLFQILTDLFWRDHTTSGWVKAVWVIFLIVFPWLGALAYLLGRRPRQPSSRPTTTSARLRAGRLHRRSRTRSRCWIPARSRKPSSTH